MSYLVLARKWRPQKFEDIVGQPHISKTLKNAIKENRVAHAYLFCGMRGIGKTTTARILAKALNCHKPTESEPCCVCPSCIQISNGNSMDVIEIDGASNNSVDDIRELREKVRFRPNRDKYKIYIIDEVHQLSNQAFNALLKTLEEPPDHIVFIFATTESHKIPMTILSRCQRYNFRRIGETDMNLLLAKIAQSENLTIDKESISLINWASEGSMRDAQSLLDQAIAYCGENIDQEKLSEILGIIDKKFLSEIYVSLSNGDKGKIFELVNTIVSSGYNLAHLHDKLIEFNRDLTVAKLSKDKGKSFDISPEEFKNLSKIAEKFTLMQLQQFHKIFADSEFQIKKSSNPRISLEMMLLKLSMVEPVISIKEILEKIDEIAKLPSTRDVPKTSYDPIHTKIPEQKRNFPTEIVAETEENPNETMQESFSELPKEIKKDTLLEKMLTELEKISSLHYTLLKDAENIETTDDKLVLIYGLNSEFYENTIDNQDFKRNVEDVATRLLGKKLKFISRLKASNTNEIKTSSKKKETRSKKPEDLPLIVQKAIDIFNGEIING
jgi:DNA polymerase III subunit gamma/tau